MAQRMTCPHCTNRFKPSLGPSVETCIYCGERIEFTERDGWVIAPAGSYRPMSEAAANDVIARYSPDQPFTIGAQATAELAEAIQVLSGAPLAQVHRMREVFLGPGVND